jgi:hypothetical protein
VEGGDYFGLVEVAGCGEVAGAGFGCARRVAAAGQLEESAQVCGLDVGCEVCDYLQVRLPITNIM